MAAKSKPIHWTETEAGRAEYICQRALAQLKANLTGFDHRVERNDVFKTYDVSMLPEKRNRYGFETKCEVVMCEHLDRCQPGHGPLAH